MTVSLADKPLPVCLTTCGEWMDELTSTAEFDRRIEATKLFKVYREVSGYYLQPRFEQEDKTPRIDRLLLPLPRLREMGWLYGAIGVECKASGVKVGPALSQCMDYARAAFVTPELRVAVLCSRVFLWPFFDCGGDLWSLMTQNRVGACGFSGADDVRFKTGGASLLRVDHCGNCFVGDDRSGRKAGSR